MLKIPKIPIIIDKITIAEKEANNFFFTFINIIPPSYPYPNYPKYIYIYHGSYYVNTILMINLQYIDEKNAKKTTAANNCCCRQVDFIGLINARVYLA